jgi:hypothetical protein
MAALHGALYVYVEHRAGPIMRLLSTNCYMLLLASLIFTLLLVGLLFMLLLVGRQRILLSTVFYTVAGGNIGLTSLVGLIFMVFKV